MQGDPKQNAGKIHESILEHLLVFKAPPGDDPILNNTSLLRLTAWTFMSPIWNISLFLRLHAWPIYESKS